MNLSTANRVTCQVALWIVESAGPWRHGNTRCVSHRQRLDPLGKNHDHGKLDQPPFARYGQRGSIGDGLAPARDSVMNPPERKTVLVTGSSGAVGGPVCRALREAGHVVRGFDRRASDHVDQMHTGDLVDRQAVNDAVAGVDAVIHLAAQPDRADFIDGLLQPNVVGLFHVMDAARNNQTARVILASSVQVVSGLLRGPALPVRAADGVAPVNHYALTKVWAEAMGEMYARCHEMSVIAVRVGWFPRNPREATRASRKSHFFPLYLSWRDTGRFFRCAVESEKPGRGEYAMLFAVSKSPDQPIVDLAPARDWIGYEPVDQFPQGLGFQWEPGQDE